MRKRWPRNEVRAIITPILRNMPFTRYSYDALYIEVIRTLDASALYKPFYLTLSDERFPSYISVSRVARKVKELNPELKPKGKSADYIELLELDWRDWARRSFNEQ